MKTYILQNVGYFVEESILVRMDIATDREWFVVDNYVIDMFIENTKTFHL